MLPNEKFTLECRNRYSEDGLVVDESNGEFAHCPLPESMGDSGYYLLHDDHQHQGLLQSRDVGRRCYWIPDVKRWLTTAHFVEGYFELWDIFDEFNRGEHNPNFGVTRSEETRRKISESLRGRPLSEEVRLRRIGRRHSEETKRKIREGNKEKTVSEETRRKIGEGNRGKIRSEEVRLQRVGIPRSEETKRKISESVKSYRERIRIEKELNQPENQEEND